MKKPTGVRSRIRNRELRRVAVELGARVILDRGGAPMVLGELLSAVCTPPRAPARHPAASVCVYLYRNTAFGFPYSPATQISEGLTQRYTFHGREASAHAGAPMYYRNRMYQANLGRFSRRDPLLGGDHLYNEYGYPGAWPSVYSDAFGLGNDLPPEYIKRKQDELDDFIKTAVRDLRGLHAGTVKDVEGKLKAIESWVKDESLVKPTIEKVAEEQARVRGERWEASLKGDTENGWVLYGEYNRLGEDLEYFRKIAEMDFAGQYGEVERLRQELRKAREAFAAGLGRSAKRIAKHTKDLDELYQREVENEGCYMYADVGKRRRFEIQKWGVGSPLSDPEWAERQSRWFNTTATQLKLIYVVGKIVTGRGSIMQRVTQKGISQVGTEAPFSLMKGRIGAAFEEMTRAQQALGVFVYVQASWEECVCPNEKDRPQWKLIRRPEKEGDWWPVSGRIDTASVRSLEESCKRRLDEYRSEIMAGREEQVFK